MSNEKINLNEFITEKMFLDLMGCIILVTGIVELLKRYLPYNPLWINLAASILVTLVRITIVGDFSFRGIVLGIFNVIPILLGATGVYESVKNILGSGN